MGKKKNADRALVRTAEGKKPLGMPRVEERIILKRILKEMQWKSVD
jgi:hypothetical protein